MVWLLQELKSQLSDVLPCVLDVTRLGGTCADGEPQHEAVVELTRHQVDLLTLVYPLQQLLVQLVGALRRRIYSAVSTNKRQILYLVSGVDSFHVWLNTGYQDN